MVKQIGFETSVFDSVDDYYAFCKKHNVTGAAAIKLKKMMDKQIPLPKVKRK